MSQPPMQYASGVVFAQITSFVFVKNREYCVFEKNICVTNCDLLHIYIDNILRGEIPMGH